MKIAVFGGTFDPVHNAHIALAGYVTNNGFADEILFMPAPSPPHKDEKSISPYEIRRRMIELAIQNMTKCDISDIEKERPGRSYTVDTLKILSQKIKNGDILLLIGSDSLRDLHLWRNPGEIVASCELLVYPRKDVALTEQMLAAHWDTKTAHKLAQCIMKDAPVSDISSTEIRRLASEGRYDEMKKLVPEPVAEYIIRHKLYVN